MLSQTFAALLKSISPRTLSDPFRDTLGRAYQRICPARDRRLTGEFYTPEWLADAVLDAAEFQGKGSLVDPACGTGVFLLRALKRNRTAQVRGYETNPHTAHAARIQWSWATGGAIDNAPIFEQDSIANPPGLRFDFVVGNPPWINWRNLDTDSRRRLAPLWDHYGLFPHRGLRARLGSGMDDLSALATYVWADRLANPGGRIALILPQALFQSAGGGAGFRRFELPGSRHLRVLRVLDFDARQCFPGATTRAVIIVMETGDRPSVFPVAYRLGEVECEASPVSPLAGAPWAIVRRGLAESMDRMRGCSPYRARVGVHSGGAAGVFWVDTLGTSGELVRIANRADAGRTKFDAIEADVETRYLRKLARGRDVQRWRVEPRTGIMLAYERCNHGKAVPEGRLHETCAHTWAYFEQFRSALIQRAHYRRHFPGAPPWSLYNVGDYTFAEHRVVWREQASDLIAAVIEGADVVADAKLTLVGCESGAEARYLAGVLNSAAARTFVRSYAVRTQISTHVLRYLRVPKYDEENELHRMIARDPESASPLCAELWGIDARVFETAPNQGEKLGRV